MYYIRYLNTFLLVKTYENLIELKLYQCRKFINISQRKTKTQSLRMHLIILRKHKCNSVCKQAYIPTYIYTRTPDMRAFLAFPFCRMSAKHGTRLSRTLVNSTCVKEFSNRCRWLSVRIFPLP